MLESRRLALPSDYVPRCNYGSPEELRASLRVSSEMSRKYIWLPVTTEIIDEFKCLFEKDASLDKPIEWERICQMQVITGVNHLFHLMILANEEKGRTFL
jgi:hypothetical protein